LERKSRDGDEGRPNTVEELTDEKLKLAKRSLAEVIQI